MPAPLLTIYQVMKKSCVCDINLSEIIAQSTVVTYIPDMAGTKDLARSECAMLISIIGISNTVAKIVSGFISDFLRVPSTYIYTIALFLAAAVNLTLPWCDRFEILAICSCVFGFCMGLTIALRTIVITDHLGIDRLTRAFGMIAMFQGIAFLVNPPLGGLVFDLTDSYIYPFVMVGLMYLLSGVMCLPLLRKSRNLRRESFDVILQDTQVIEPLCIDSKPPMYTEDDTCQHKNSTNVVINVEKVFDPEVSHSETYLSPEKVKCPSG